MARPRITIDQEQFKGLCSLQCTLEEIASFFKCSEDTVERWCQRELKMSFADAYKKHSVNGKISLRRYQYKMAEHVPSMAIWLGKQWLGQRDVIEAQVPQVESSVEQIAKMILNDKQKGK
jgi:AraC-like DNA-binding protein